MRLRRPPTWRTVAVLSAVAVVVSTIPGVALTNASWIDEEYAYGTLIASQCGVSTDFDSRATGRMVAGAIANTQLDPVVALHGIVVSNDGSTATATASSTPGGSDAYYSSLAATAISTAFVNAGLGLPLAWNTGAWTQYGQAHDSGISTGAAGAVTNAGAINTTTTGPTAAPTVGSLALSSLPYVGAPLSGLSDVSLDIGAVASRATLDGCGDVWTAGVPTAAQLQRSYYVSHLRAQLTSAALAGLMGTTGSVIGLLDSRLTTAFGTSTTQGTAETSVVTASVGSLTTLVDNSLALVSATGLAGVSVRETGGTVQVAVDTTPVRALLSETVNDGVVAYNLGSGAVTVDIKALAGGLDAKPANTPLLTAPQLADITSRLTTIVNARIAALTTAITAVLESATVTVALDAKVQARLPLGSTFYDVLNVHVGLTGTLKSFVDGTATSHGGVTVSGPTVSVLTTGVTAVDLLTGVVGTALGVILGGVGLLNPVLTAVLDATELNAFTGVTSLLPALVTTAGTLATTALTTLSGTLTALGGIVSVTLNSQPDQLPNPAAPYSGGGAGEYFVSALRIGVLDRTGGGANSLVNLFLATSSVGSNAS